jgi:CheY-like chemotaxis protein
MEKTDVVQKKILVIENDLEEAARLAGACQGVGFDVRVESDRGQAALRAFEWRPDVIALDLEAPGLDGREVIRQLQSQPQTSRIPVLVLSGGGVPIELLTGEKDRFIQKPRVLEGVVDSLRRLTSERPR